jgi:serine/threonine-protein kinase
MQSEQFSLAAAVDLALQIAGALAAAHGAGIVHRDIKPENVMVRPDGLVKVLDFGVAKIAHGRPAIGDREALVQTAQGVVVGTATYMSPEQARGLEVDARTDIWSLGVVLYEMITQRLPFSGASAAERIAAILERDPQPLGTWRPKVPAELERIVSRMLAKNREDRYARTLDLVADL